MAGAPMAWASSIVKTKTKESEVARVLKRGFFGSMLDNATVINISPRMVSNKREGTRFGLRKSQCLSIGIFAFNAHR